jgi:hypothetical protein
MISRSWCWLVLGVSAWTASAASAHFPWMAKDADGKAILFFGENPADRTYRLPPSIAATQIEMRTGDNETWTALPLSPIERDDLVGLISETALPSKAQARAAVTFGIYKGARLDYFTTYQAGPLPTDRKSTAAGGRLQAELIDSPTGVDVYVTFDGKPLADVDVKLFCSEGHEEGSAKTDSDGKAALSDGQIESGLNGILLGFTDSSAAGELDGKAYTSTMFYLTATFDADQLDKP